MPANIGAKHHSAKLTSLEVREIRTLYETGRFSQRELGERFGVNQKTICDIVRRVIWQHIS